MSKERRDDREGDDEDDRVRRPRRRKARDDDRDAPEDAALGAVVPMGVSVWALLAVYSSLLSCVIPGLGLLSILFGILALMAQQRKTTYGSVTGNIRAIIGIALGLITTVFWGIAMVAILMSK